MAYDHHAEAGAAVDEEVFTEPATTAGTSTSATGRPPRRVTAAFIASITIAFPTSM